MPNTILGLVSLLRYHFQFIRINGGDNDTIFCCVKKKHPMASLKTFPVNSIFC